MGVVRMLSRYPFFFFARPGRSVNDLYPMCWKSDASKGGPEVELRHIRTESTPGFRCLKAI